MLQEYNIKGIEFHILEKKDGIFFVQFIGNFIYKPNLDNPKFDKIVENPKCGFSIKNSKEANYTSNRGKDKTLFKTLSPLSYPGLKCFNFLFFLDGEISLLEYISKKEDLTNLNYLALILLEDFPNRSYYKEGGMKHAI